ncbi:hypothetical protein [Micromonospora sp. U21]|uniref:hypothetical protein n=1 Tax=Micromonospora sp. U21 TaxID=2824899 RepID=UPI001B374C0B|nr:hypothetical protein [Micromonospora sp. U21]MBQ0905493.1 hypothetical protein [Micromonospora sp. U21]
MSFVSYYSEPSGPSKDSEPSGPSKHSRRRRTWRRLAARLRAFPKWRIKVREREPRAEVAAWFGKTAAGELVQRLAQPLASASLVAGVGVAALAGLLIGSLVDLTVAPVPALATVTTAFVIGLAVGFGGGGPLPALSGGLFGWLVAEAVQSSVSELVKQPASRVAGVAIGWCLAALAGWVAGRVAALLPWPWVVAAAGVAVVLGVRWTVSCARDQQCAADLTSGALTAMKWGTVAAIWLFALVVLIWLRMLRAALAWDSRRARLWPFALLYTFWWAPLLTVAALRAFNPGYRLTGADLGGFYVAMTLPLLLEPAYPVMGYLLPIGQPAANLAVTMPQSRQIVVRNAGRRTVKRLACQAELEWPNGERTELFHNVPPKQLAPDASCTLTLRLAADKLPPGTKPYIVLTWRERLRIRQIRQPLHYPRKDPLQML